ncbi:hypothetical protein [Halosegnis sp.]|uniref:hypothetical protein n=1 Tax=Halosegnis sp. TaxID=2864959 RepID=UPI0035D4CA79
MSDSFLVYDGRNRLYRAAAKQVARLSEDIRLVPWRSKSTRDFIEAQFGDHLFVFVLIDPETDKVHAGGETVRRLLCERGVPQLLIDGAERAYQVVGDPLGRVLHGQPPADVDGTFPLAEDARPHLESLRRECSLAACASGEGTE